MGRVSCWGLCLMAAVVAAGCDPEPIDPNPNPSQRLFQSRLIFGAAGAPLAAVTMDLNEDGKADIATANGANNAVGVLLAGEGASYLPAAAYPVNGGPGAIAAGDLNGDGRVDLVTANAVTHDISVLLSLGEGTFAPAVHVALDSGANPAAIATGHFNADEFLDVAVAGSGTNILYLLAGLGDGSFSTTIGRLSVGAGPRSIAVADLDEDGDQDLVVAERNTNSVSVIISGGDGSFATPLQFEVGTNPRQVSVVDVTGEGAPDLVVSNPGSRDITVLPRGGAAFFLPAITTPFPATPTRFTSGDFNGDGRIDLAVITFNSDDQPSGTIVIGHGDGEGVFDDFRVFGAGRGAIDVLSANLAGDARADLLSLDAAAGTVSLIQGRAQGSFQTDERFPAGNRPRDVATGDFDRDGHLDAVVTNLDSDTLSLYFGRGDGSFEVGSELDVSGIPRALAIGRINGDVNDDIVVTNLNNSRVSLFLGRGDGTFQAEKFVSIRATGESRSAQPRSLALADMNNDTRLDIVTGNAGTDTVAIALGDGAGNFAAAEETRAGNFPLGIAVADVDGDGNLDVLATNGVDPEDTGSTPGRVNRLFGNGDGTLDEESRLSVATGDTPRDLAAGDLDDDGDIDAVTVHQGDDRVFILAGSASGALSAGESRATGDSPNSCLIADVSDDGRLDILTANNDGSVSVLTHIAGMLFSAPLRFPAGTDLLGLHVADLNEDGISDLLATNRSTNELVVLLGID